MSPRNWAVSGQQSTHAISEGAEVCRSNIAVAVGFGINRPSSLLLGRRSERSGSHSSYSRTVLTAFGACCFILVFARQSQRDRRSILLICITELVQAALVYDVKQRFCALCFEICSPSLISPSSLCGAIPYASIDQNQTKVLCALF